MSSTIELNGKKYDAATGSLLGSGTSHRYPSKVTGTIKAHHRGRSMDGFAVKAQALVPKTSPVANQSSLPTKRTVVGTRAMDGFARTSSNELTPHRPERSHTLMRGAVKMPHLALKPAIKKQLPVERQAATLSTVAPKLSASQVNPNRLEHARKVPRSQHIKHFNARPQQATPVVTPVQTAISLPRKQPASAPAAPEQSEEDMFEKAIAQATSHEQKAPKKRGSWKRKLAGSAAVVVALIVVGIFVAYLNLPTIELNLASTQAGFKPTIPNYKALGFTFDSPIKTTSGKVSMSFSSGDSQFTLTQQPSNWDNQTLMETLATQSDIIPKTIQSAGHTIYMTHTNQATWVNGGIRYDLTGNANLNNQEIAAVVGSM